MTARIRALLVLLVLVSLFVTPALASAAETDGGPFDVKFSGVIETAPAAQTRRSAWLPKTKPRPGCGPT